MTTETAQTQLVSHPWQRWGWLAGGVWLLFLAFPVTTILERHAGGGQRALGLVLVALFAVVYALGFVRLFRSDYPVPGAWPLLVVLVALIGGVATVIGTDAMAMAPFAVAWVAWSQPWPRGGWYAAGLTALGLLVLALAPGDDGVYLLPLLLVLGFSALMRVFDTFTERQAEIGEALAVVAERERVARDVHDVLGHSLTAISVKAELASRMLEVDQTRAARELAEVQELARDALAEIRSTVAGLRATRIEDELETARETLTASGITPEVVGDPDDVGVAQRIVLAWAVREAVTNVIRHSRASRCRIALGPRSLVVTDDGVGATGPEGNGLRGLRERVSASGGTVTSGPGPDGRGHELRVEL